MPDYSAWAKAFGGGSKPKVKKLPDGATGLKKFEPEEVDGLELEGSGGNPYAIGAENERAQAGLARDLRVATKAGERPPEQYLQFLQNAGIDDATIRAVANGELPMDDASRAARAIEMGLDPGMKWHRADVPGKTQFLGRAREGLVYASADARLARDASQAGSSQMYPLIAGKNLAGMEGGREARRILEATVTDKARVSSEHKRMFGPLPSRQPVLRPGTGTDELGGFVFSNPMGHRLPFWGEVEDADAVAAMRASEKDGTLVLDEGGVSAAILGPLRHSSLSVLSPQNWASRNIFYAVPPAAAGALYGLTDDSQKRPMPQNLGNAVSY
jgi:hypothetical protein